MRKPIVGTKYPERGIFVKRIEKGCSVSRDNVHIGVSGFHKPEKAGAINPLAKG